MACPTFPGRQLVDPPQHAKNVRLWMVCKKLPARTPMAVPVDGERNMAEISYFASTLKVGATLWLNSLTIDMAPAVIGAIGTLTARHSRRSISSIQPRNGGICRISSKINKCTLRNLRILYDA